jgi:hypothetical protein
MRAIRVLLAAVVALVLGAAPAFAHAPVKERTPKPGSTVSKVRTVSVRFGEAGVTARCSPDPWARGRTRSSGARWLTMGTMSAAAGRSR